MTADVVLYFQIVFFIVCFVFYREAKRPQTKDAAMDVEVCESEGVCDVLCRVPSGDPEREESMETHVPGEEAAAAQGSETNTAPPKPQYSYRLVRAAQSLKCQGQIWPHLFGQKTKVLSSL